ncbi:glycosyltransferase family 4 protein [Microtetraspora sp. AC03309]|nr:glycosyltransferase family 4 protein [Microtetraspora sp. AC03309]
MASVMRLMVDQPDERFTVTAVPTFVDTHIAGRVWVGVSGMILATARILVGHIDVLHVHLAHGGSVVRKAVPLLAARLRGIPAVVHGHSFNFSGWLDPLPAGVRLLVRAVLRADHWLVLGQSLAVDYQRSLGLSHTPIEVLYNPVVMPADRSRPARTSRSLAVVSLGRVGRRKGSYDLVRAVELLPADLRTRLHVVLAGDGEVEQLRTVVAARGLDEVIEVAGWIEPPERDQLLRGADIFVLPSYHEGLPMALLEAMAHGVIPITTPVGGIPEAVTDGVDGLLVPPGDPARLAAALQRLSQDDELRTRLSEAARQRAQAFDIDRWRERLGQLWVSLAGRRRA